MRFMGTYETLSMKLASNKMNNVVAASRALAENLGPISDKTSNLVGNFGIACNEYGMRVGFIDGIGVGFALGASFFTAAFLAVNVLPELIEEMQSTTIEEDN